MPYQVTRREIISNDLLMPEVTSSTIPDAGWQYHFDGVSQYAYIFATWKSELDDNFPPVITGGGTIKAIYWYLLQGGGPGIPKPQVTCYAMFLGDEATDAFFNQENPIDDVNGQEWTGGRTVSTANGAVTITPETSVSGDAFDRWLKVWGNFTISGSTLTAPDQGYGAAIAVYVPQDIKRPKFPYEDVLAFVDQVVLKEDLVADYLDEYRHIVQAYTDRDPRTEVQVEKAIAEIEARDPEAIQQRLLEVRADMHRLEAMEKILGTLARGD